MINNNAGRSRERRAQVMMWLCLKLKVNCFSTDFYHYEGLSQARILYNRSRETIQQINFSLSDYYCRKDEIYLYNHVE